jgi:hypothetical protein
MAPVRTADLSSPEFKDAFLDEIRRQKRGLHGMVIAQARTIQAGPGGVTFVFSPSHDALRRQLEQQRPWLQALAEQMCGRKVEIAAEIDTSTAEPTSAPMDEKSQALRQRALEETAVQAMLEVFPAEIRDVEELDQ